MVRILSLPSTSLLSALLVVNTVAKAADTDGFRPLFNEQDLSSWVLVNTTEATWTVKDKMLICSGKPIGEIRTDRMYQNFILEVEWRHMKPRGNAGIFVWADDITARGVPFHRSVEVQVLENAYGNTRGHTTHGDIFPIHGAKMTPINGRGGSRAFPTEERSKPSPQWNHYRIVCQDGEISLAVNGKVVTRGKDASPRKGYICLESEGGIVHYRNLRIKELPDTPVEPEHIAIANRGYRTLYTGLNLTGWQGESLDHWHANDWVLSYDGKADSSPAMATAKAFKDYGFVFDVKLQKDTRSISMLHGDAEAFTISWDDAAFADHLQKAGSWNRVEVSVAEAKLSVTLNGQEVLAKQFPAGATAASIAISPQGTADFANLFIRQLN